MSIDVHIHAKIIEKATGRCITEAQWQDEWFCVLWLCGHDGGTVWESWAKILKEYTECDRLRANGGAPFPQNCLREMCSCLFSYAVLPEKNRALKHIEYGFWEREKADSEPLYTSYTENDHFTADDWDEQQYTEDEFLRKAVLLRDFIYELDRIHYENSYKPLPADKAWGLHENGEVQLPDSFIVSEDDLRRFREDPQAYEWKFRLDIYA